MLIELGRNLPRRWVVSGTVAAAVAAVSLTGVGPATAAQVTTVVSCSANPGALQSAITAASPGDTLLVSGTCTGPFTINKNLTVRGASRAVLDGNQAGSTVTVG